MMLGIFCVLIGHFYKVFFFLNVSSCLRDRERQSTSSGGAESEGHTDSEAGSRLRALSADPDVGLELMNWELMT